MISTKTKSWLTKVPAIWLLIAGAGLTVLGLFCLGSFFSSCGINEHGVHEPDLLALMVSVIAIPGLLFLFSGYSVLQRMFWWLAFLCLVILCIGPLWWALIGGSWFIATPIIFCSIAAAVLLIISKDNFF